MRAGSILVVLLLLTGFAVSAAAEEQGGMLYPQTDFWAGIKYVNDLNGMSYQLGSQELKALLTSTTAGMAYYNEYESKKMLATVVELGSVVIMLVPVSLMAYSYNNYETYLAAAVGGLILGCVGEMVGSFLLYDAQNNFNKAVNTYNRAFGCGTQTPKNYNLPPQGNSNTGNSGEVIKGGAAYNF